MYAKLGKVSWQARLSKSPVKALLENLKYSEVPKDLAAYWNMQLYHCLKCVLYISYGNSIWVEIYPEADAESKLDRKNANWITQAIISSLNGIKLREILVRVKPKAYIFKLMESAILMKCY